jgi:prophage regulatory protein
VAPTVLRRPEVERRTGLSRSTIYVLIADHGFPEPIRLGPRAVGWLDDEVAAWIRTRAAERSLAPPSMHRGKEIACGGQADQSAVPVGQGA